MPSGPNGIVSFVLPGHGLQSYAERGLLLFSIIALASYMSHFILHITSNPFPGTGTCGTRLSPFLSPPSSRAGLRNCVQYVARRKVCVRRWQQRWPSPFALLDHIGLNTLKCLHWARAPVHARMKQFLGKSASLDALAIICTALSIMSENRTYSMDVVLDVIRQRCPCACDFPMN